MVAGEACAFFLAGSLRCSIVVSSSASTKRSGPIMITLEANSPVPPYEQVRVQIVEQVQDQRLPAGTKLPTIRRLAEDLGLAPNTVARAYRELEHDGVIETRGRHGTFVSGSADRTTRLAQEAAAEYAQRIKRLKITSADALRFVEQALDMTTG